MNNITSKASQNSAYKHFEQAAPKYSNYKKQYDYYWKDIVNYFNYFIHEDNSVLEIGCGVGDTIGRLKGNRKVGIDFSPLMIDEARKQHPNVTFEVMDAATITLEEKFDVIIISGVIGYLESVQDVFLSMKRVCHERTRIIISYYNYLWEPALSFGELLGFKKKGPKQNWLSYMDIENLLYLSDYDPYKVTRRQLIPVNIPIVSFLCNRYLAKMPMWNSLALSQFVFARPALGPDPKIDEKYSVTIVIPARNEAGNIENAILRMPKFGKHQEIIFVEGNSTDNTWETIQQIQEKYKGTHDIRITQQEGKGKGDAVRKGYSIATGDILMILDADLTVPPEDLPKFYHAIASGKGEFINGSRLVYPMEENAMRFLNTLGNKFFSMVFTWMLEQPIKDSLCGTKVMFRDDYVKLVKNRTFFGEFDPFGDFDLLFGAFKLNLKIIDLPIRYRERVYGETNISRFKHGFLLLRMCWFAAGKVKFI
jgi:ubiquinone/menaquinone biosynthesis C-methylase UbiE